MKSINVTARPCRVCLSARRQGATLQAANLIARSAKDEPLSYKTAGVDIDAGNELVNRIKKMNPSIGGFNGLFPFGDSYLVGGTDGVGTKLKLAFEMDKHDTIGIDLVAMCVNDLIICGAKPLFFLDYFATGGLDVDVAEKVVKGIYDGCGQCGATLMGGETAEMPGMYQPKEYDLAGFAVGAVKKDELVDGKSIVAGDALIALPSSGVHSNGFSLVRAILDKSGTKLTDETPWGAGAFGDALLTPTTIYVNAVLKLKAEVGYKGAVHVTGGGFPENLPRVVPKGCACEIDRATWQIPELFQWLQRAGGVETAEMFRTFNMGVGMVIAVDASKVDAALAALPEAFVIGKVIDGEGVSYLNE